MPRRASRQNIGSLSRGKEEEGGQGGRKRRRGTRLEYGREFSAPVHTRGGWKMRWKFRVAARGRGSSTLARPVIAPCLTKSVWQFVFDDPSPPRVAARGIADGKRYFHDRPRLVCDSSAREICFPAYGASFSRGEEGGRIVSDDVLNFPTSLPKVSIVTRWWFAIASVSRQRIEIRTIGR